MKVQIGLMMVILLIATGCNPSSSSTPQATITTTEEASSSTDKSSRTSSGMMTYVDTRSGVAFDYPSGWKIIEPPTDDAVIYSYSLASYDLTNPSAPTDKSESGLPAGQTKIDVTFYGPDETPDSARRTVQADVDSGFVVIVKEETRTAADGSPAYYYAIQGRLGGTAQVLYTSVNGHTVSIVAYGDSTNFEDVVKSLRSS